MKNWQELLKPVLEKYRGRKHPLEYQNSYQLICMVILAAQDSDKHINSIAPAFFRQFPTLGDVAQAQAEELYPYLDTVRSFRKKSNWIVNIARELLDESRIPATLEGLTSLPGIGRKSANVIMREMGQPAEGIIVDLHVLRVAPRIGIAKGTNAEKIEKQLMEAIPKENWHEAGMAFSFLGREICRPSNPKCDECMIMRACEYYRTVVKKSTRKGRKKMGTRKR
jgi:endonuclease-3